MQLLLQEIERALQARLYYLAIVTVVTLPDVCAALSSNDGESNGQRYRDWYNANVAPTLTWFSDTDCWKFRCGGVHQGRFGHRDMQYDRAIFLLPGPIQLCQGISRNNGGIQESAYLYSADEFCRVFVGAARAWLLTKQDDPVVQANMQHLVQLRPNGLAPHIVGTPVIA